MYILTYFTDEGTPSTGLSPTIRIRDLSDNSLVVTDAAMEEVGDGLYKYNFTTYDDSKDYSVRCDGGATLGDIDRYTYAGGDNTESLQATTIKVLTGKWEIADNQLIMYDSDGTTALYTFDLTQNGVATEFNPDLRTPV